MFFKLKRAIERACRRYLHLIRLLLFVPLVVAVVFWACDKTVPNIIAAGTGLLALWSYALGLAYDPITTYRLRLDTHTERGVVTLRADKLILDPTGHPVHVPAAVQAWPDSEGYTPDDGSWGFIQLKGHREHIRHGEWVFINDDDPAGPIDVVRPQDMLTSAASIISSKLSAANALVERIRSLPVPAPTKSSLEYVQADETLTRARGVVQVWLDKQGHDKCHYYPDLFNELAGILEIEVKSDSQLPPREEFRAGCRKYEDELYGDTLNTVQRLEAATILDDQGRLTDYPPIPDYLGAPFLFMDRCMGPLLVATWGDPPLKWLFRIGPDGKQWVSLRVVTVADRNVLDGIQAEGLRSSGD